MDSARRAVLPLAACAVAVFGQGGYGPVARVAFAALALLAAVVARPPARALREPVVAVLVVLALLGLLSATWTVGPVGDAVRWGLVTAGYAGLVVAAASAARSRDGVLALAAGLAVIAAVAAALGLACAALGDDTFAERIAGVWRPGGPFEYPPALALAEVSALPILLAGALRPSRLAAGAAAIGLALVAGVLALAASRTSLALGIVVAGLAVAQRRELLGVIVLAAAAGVCEPLARLLYPGLPRLALDAAVVGACAPAWLALRTRVPVARRSPRAAVAVPVVLVLAVVGGALAFGAAADRGYGPATDILHGRGATWRAAVETFADRPLHGAGADAFLTASARHQGGATIVYAHDLPLEAAAELGVGGLIAVLALYAAAIGLLWRARAGRAAVLFGPAVAAFLISNLVDWPWHLAGAGGIWALATGALAGAAARVRYTPADRGCHWPGITSIKGKL